MNTKKTIFLTGATGNMGRETLREILDRGDRFKAKILVLPAEREKPEVQSLMGRGDLEIVWGDLTNYDDILRGVTGTDYVLHLGGLVSPFADRFPELTMKVNVGAARNIVAAIRAQPDPNRVRLAYIGTVAETGSRMPPIHWGRTGDPIKISHFDHYAVSKTQAEAIIAESGLRYWVSLRQTGMAHLRLREIFDPIIFHNPINGVFEWATAHDSGRLMANVCEERVPEGFWRSFYNIGGGAYSRVVNHEFLARSNATVGVKDFRAVMRPNWFATRNFHGQWYTDSDDLEALVPFRRESFDDFVVQLDAQTPSYLKMIGRFVPGLIAKRTRQLAESPGGTLHWIAHNDVEHINAFFGSRAAWERIPDWDSFALASPSRTPSKLDHGYDESKPRENWTASDLRTAAEFRGGQCLSDQSDGPFKPVTWRCALGHDFSMTPNLMLKGGHWCPSCMIESRSYREVARRSRFFAQVWQEGSDAPAA